MRRALALALAATGGALLLSACSGETPVPAGTETDIPEGLLPDSEAPESAATDEGTPMAERVATLGLLNKRNNRTQDLVLKPGESRRVGDVIVRLSACERTPQWENPPETGAFVQVLVQERRGTASEDQWYRVFSGWLFRNSPSLNVVEHPVYDVWVKDCAMSFPGESAPAASASASNE